MDVEKILTAVAASQLRAEKRMDRLEASQLRADERMDRLEASQLRAEKRMDRLEKNVGRLEKSISALEKKVNTTADVVRVGIQLVRTLTKSQKDLSYRIDAVADGQMRTEAKIDRLIANLRPRNGNGRH